MEIKLRRNPQSFVFLFCLVSIGLIYLINPYQIVYLFTEWQNFGELPVVPVQILGFDPKTSAWIGYVESTTGDMFTCKEAIAYLKTENQSVYRCCNSPEKVSCTATDYPNLITDIKCDNYLRGLFQIPDKLLATRDYKVFGYCPDSGNPNITIVQITNTGEVLWKSIDTLNLDLISTGLKCFIGPLLIVLAGWITLKVIKARDSQAK